MTRIVTHRVDHRSDPSPVIELPPALAELRDQYGALCLIGLLAQLEAADAARFRARLEPTAEAHAAQLAAALRAFVVQAEQLSEATLAAARVGARTALSWVRR